MTYLGELFLRGGRAFLALARIMLPVMVVVQAAQWLGLVEWLGRAMAPAMSLLDLPPEAGIVWVTTLLTGLYGGIAALSGFAPLLELSVGQLSALCAMMLFAHALPIEQAIVRRAGASFWLTSALRVGVALIYGAAVAWASRLSGVLDEPVSLAWLRGSSLVGEHDGLWGWLQSTAFTLAMTFAVIVALLLLLDALARLGITRWITRALTPLLRLSGLDSRVATVTTVGVLLGLTYGGAIIIDEAEKQRFSVRTRFLALAWLSLSHSLIEDTLLMLALGADIWVVLAGRVLVTLGIVALIARAWPDTDGSHRDQVSVRCDVRSVVYESHRRGQAEGDER